MKAKYDKDGYDKDGYNENGYHKDGYDMQGYDKAGFAHDADIPFPGFLEDLSHAPVAPTLSSTPPPYSQVPDWQLPMKVNVAPADLRIIATEAIERAVTNLSISWIVNNIVGAIGPIATAKYNAAHGTNYDYKELKSLIENEFEEAKIAKWTSEDSPTTKVSGFKVPALGDARARSSSSSETKGK